MQGTVAGVIGGSEGQWAAHIGAHSGVPVLCEHTHGAEHAADDADEGQHHQRCKAKSQALYDEVIVDYDEVCGGCCACHHDWPHNYQPNHLHTSQIYLMSKPAFREGTSMAWLRTSVQRKGRCQCGEHAMCWSTVVNMQYPIMEHRGLDVCNQGEQGHRRTLSIMEAMRLPLDM